jgi:hypothetical protein
VKFWTARRMAMVEAKRVGTMEVRTSKRVRLVDAYAVFVDGKERQPWLQKRAALAEVKAAAIAELDAAAKKDGGR